MDLNLNTQIYSIGDNVFAGCSNITFVVIPATVTNPGNLGAGMLNQSNVQHIVFLGLSLAQVQSRILSTQFFGLRRDCLFQCGSDRRIFQYNAQSNSISTYSSDAQQYGQKILTQQQIDFTPAPGRHAKFSINKLYQYDNSLVNKALGIGLPIIVFYIDSRTSSRAREFINTILKHPNIKKFLNDKEHTATPNVLFLVLDRAWANAGQGGQITHFKGTFLNNKSDGFPGFPCIAARYGNTIKYASFHGLF